MKKFHFKLQKVLEFKEHLEKRKQQELSVIQNKLDTANNDLDNLINEKSISQQEHKNMISNGCKLLDIMLFDQYCEGLKIKIEHQNIVIKNISNELLNKQTELLNIVKEKKSLETYKDKKINEYQKVLNTFEQTLLDEVALRQFYYSPTN